MSDNTTKILNNLLDGMQNVIDSAKANGDKYTVGYVGAMLKDGVKLKALLTAPAMRWGR